MRFIEFITEVYETDLNALYRKYNNELFNGELPNIRVRWNNSKRTAGAVRYTVRIDSEGNKELAQLQHINISKALDLSAQDLASTLIHEMIHVYLLEIGIIDTSGGDEHHGIEFQEKKKEIEQKTGFLIPDTEDVHNRDVADHHKDKVKTLGAVLVKHGEGYSLGLYDTWTIMDQWPAIHRTYKAGVEDQKYEKVYMGLVNTNLHFKYPVRRSAKVLKTRFINGREAMQILQSITDNAEHAIIQRDSAND